VRNARHGEGPAYLEFATYRWREHCGPNYDNNIGYRTEKEFQEWQKKCPVQTYQRMLVDEGILSENDIKKAASALREEIDQAFVLAEAAPFPGDDELTTGVYA
jgi:pyruvate dehydrogenase E1 component alpha subunit